MSVKICRVFLRVKSVNYRVSDDLHATGENQNKGVTLSLLLAVGGVFCSTWLCTAVGLYYFVWGDDGTAYGTYATPPSMIFAALSFVFLHRRKSTTMKVAIFTSPALVFFTLSLLVDVFKGRWP